MKNIYQILIITYIDGNRIEHKLAPIALDENEYLTKLEEYTTYDTWDYFSGICIDDLEQEYDIILNKELLQKSYFKFTKLGQLALRDE